MSAVPGSDALLRKDKSGAARSFLSSLSLKASTMLRKSAKYYTIAAKDSDKPDAKILFLGVQESGRSTMYQHCCYRAGVGKLKRLQDGESDAITHNVRTKVIRSVVSDMIEVADELVRPGHQGSSEKSLFELVEKLRKMSPLPHSLSAADLALMKKLWSLDFVRNEIYGRNGNIDHNLGYFMEKLENFPEYGGQEWVPNVLDALSAHEWSAAPASQGITVEDDVVVQLVDEGSGKQGSEVERWKSLIQLHANTTELLCLVYIVPMADFEARKYPEERKSMLLHSLECFEELDAFIKKSNIKIAHLSLVFNKMDLFEKKLKQKIVFPNSEFQSLPNTANSGVVKDWIIRRFKNRDSFRDTTVAHEGSALDKYTVKEFTEIIFESIVKLARPN